MSCIQAACAQSYSVSLRTSRASSVPSSITERDKRCSPGDSFRRVACPRLTDGPPSAPGFEPQLCLSAADAVCCHNFHDQKRIEGIPPMQDAASHPHQISSRMMRTHASEYFSSCTTRSATAATQTVSPGGMEPGSISQSVSQRKGARCGASS